MPRPVHKHANRAQAVALARAAGLRLLLYGQALNLFLAYAIPPHVVQGIITTAITGLGHLFGLGGLPPSIPPQA
jgi:hypothetical protein